MSLKRAIKLGYGIWDSRGKQDSEKFIASRSLEGLSTVGDLCIKGSFIFMYCNLFF